MNPSRVFIERPVATTLLTIAVAIAGIIAFTVLPVSPLPQIDFPTITVGASLPGASPDIMASSIATPLERQFGHIAGITEMTSASALGTTSVTLQFDLSRDINGAARDVEAAINAARTYLPQNLPSNPTYRKVNPADSPILILGLQSDVADIPTLYDEASTVIAQRISQIDGVGQVNAVGASLPAVRVELNPQQLAHYGIALTAVQAVISGQNSNLAKGQLGTNDQNIDILANDQISKAEFYKPLVIGYHNGGAVRLQDVADVVDSQQTIRQAGFVNGKPSVNLIILRQPGANIIKTVDAVKAAIPSLQATIPANQKIITVMDRTQTIRASVANIEGTLVISVILVILVVFVFLRNLPATLVPAVAVPVSLIGTCAVMYLCGYSLDNLSLMALAIASGFVVDDAIVVMENISRHLEDGMTPVAAALQGAEEIGFTVFSISISLIAVFIPLLLMSGLIGRLFREFAVTLSTAIIVSMLISLSTTPMMCSRVLKSEHSIKHGKLWLWSERVFNAILARYRRSLNWVLDHPLMILIIFVVIVVLNVYLIRITPNGLFPQQDNGVMMGGLQGPQNASFYSMKQAVQQAVKIVKADPDVDNVMAFTGGQGSTNSGNMFIALKPLAQRQGRSSSQIVNDLRPKLTQGVLGSNVFLQASQDLRIGGRGGNAQYQYNISADSTELLQTYGPMLLAGIRKIPGVTDANTDQQNNGLQALMSYDRLTAARLGFTPSTLDKTLCAAFCQSEVSTIYTELNQYYVVMEVAPKYWVSPSGLQYVYAVAGNGTGPVPLNTMMTYQTSTAPLSVNHTGLFPSVTVSFNLAPGVALSQVSQGINQLTQNLNLPTTVHGAFAGTALAYQQTQSTEIYLIITAIIAVYIVLGILYESLVHPLTIISTIPSASIGAILALLLTKTQLDIISIIGIILLIGIVKKNAIMMIDFALHAEREEGMNTRDSIFKAATLRFRPIMMTTLAALFGAVPLAVGTGMGAELRRPLGITIIGGLLVSQIITLYSTPVIYLFMDNLRLKIQGDKSVRLFSSAPAGAH